jgi:hypothetical protein
MASDDRKIRADRRGNRSPQKISMLCIDATAALVPVALHSNTGNTLVCFHPFPESDCIVTALNPGLLHLNPDAVWAMLALASQIVSSD